MVKINRELVFYQHSFNKNKILPMPKKYVTMNMSRKLA